MLEIRLFGGTDLRADGKAVGWEMLSQTRPTALLAYLALAETGDYLRRDHLVGLFWPESDQAHARNNLRKLLMSLRRSLGADLLEVRGDEEVRLVPERVWCDAADFKHCVRQSRFDRAMALYRGALLDGFIIEGAFAFQEWLDATRRHLAREALKLALRMADEHVQRDERTAAGDIVQFILRVEPDLEDEHQLRKLIALLDRMGDRIGAIRLYERYRERLWKEFRVSLAPETRELIERIKAR
jgi:DNA-binding SARP family transcriptional activator